MTVVSTASGLLAMLQEDHPTLKLHALKNLNVLSASLRVLLCETQASAKTATKTATRDRTGDGLGNNADCWCMTLVGSSAGRVVKLPLLERAGISAVASGIAGGFTKRNFTPHRHREDEAADEGRFEAILWPSGRSRQGAAYAGYAHTRRAT